jgi:hypothetical protein
MFSGQIGTLTASPTRHANRIVPLKLLLPSAVMIRTE